MVRQRVAGPKRTRVVQPTLDDWEMIQSLHQTHREASTHRLGLPGSDSAPAASGSSHLVALETQVNLWSLPGLSQVVPHLSVCPHSCSCCHSHHVFLTSTCCKMTPFLFLLGKLTGDLNALASHWNEKPATQGPGYT